jgi:hypothetical protein
MIALAPLLDGSLFTKMMPMHVLSNLPSQGLLKKVVIYVMGTTLYQVESGKGIHVLSFNNPSNPQKLAFIEVPGAQEISIKGSYLYTNNYNDLVVLDIAELTDVKVIKRMKDLFTFTTMDTPPLPGYFECVDPSKGRVVDWEQTTIYSPKCKL